nr:cupin [Actinomycetes bacterium]MCH9738699.1 cupin [Actinomycetes bacterium]
MPELIPAPVHIPVPGGKTIEEYAGHVATGDDRVSIAHMVAPAGWTEPEQTPEFDEFTVVLEGSLMVDSENGPTRVN